MSLFDRWMSNLGLGKSSSQLANNKSRSELFSNSSLQSPSPLTPSRHSLPSASTSNASLAPPQPKPTAESRVVRGGPEPSRRRSLISGDHSSVNLNENRPRKTYLQPRLSFLSTPDREPLPSFRKVRTTSKFFHQHEPLTTDQIRDLFWVEEASLEDHYLETAKTLNRFRQRKRHCDVRLLTDTGRFYCHKAVLVTFSKELQNRLESSSLWKTGKISVDLTNRGFDDLVMGCVLDWMYTGRMRLNIVDNLENLLEIADGLSIYRLREICEKVFPNAASMPACSATFSPREPVVQAVRSSQSFLQKQPSLGPRSSISNVVNSEDFLQWPPERVCSYLSGDSLNIESELDVYSAIVRWINYNKPNRISSVELLGKCARWSFMSPDEIVAAKRLDPALFSESSFSNLAAMGQWQRDLLLKGIHLPNATLSKSRIGPRILSRNEPSR